MQVPAAASNPRIVATTDRRQHAPCRRENMTQLPYDKKEILRG
jgi:hypothetical protein